jgi:uncharacterized protein
MEDYFRQNIWVTTSGYFNLPPLQCAVEMLGVNRLLFSVDYPFSTNQLGREFLDHAADLFNAAEMNGFTHGIAEQQLRLPKTGSF